MNYTLQSTRHAKYLLHVHLVFTLKYRKQIFIKEHFEVMQKVFTDICKRNNASLLEFDGETDHVHLLILYPPRIAVASLVNSLKGVSSRMLRKQFPIFKNTYYGNDVALWSRSYFAASVGGAPLELLKQYIQQQNTTEIMPYINAIKWRWFTA